MNDKMSRFVPALIIMSMLFSLACSTSGFPIGQTATSNITVSNNFTGPQGPQGVQGIQGNTGNAGSNVSVQDIVTGSRAANNTVYHNTYSVPLFVSITSHCASNGDLIQVHTDNTTDPTAYEILVTGNASNYINCFFIVLPGNYYKVLASGLTFWTEWH